jgi:hypothetical protein
MLSAASRIRSRELMGMINYTVQTVQPPSSSWTKKALRPALNAFIVKLGGG